MKFRSIDVHLEGRGNRFGKTAMVLYNCDLVICNTDGNTPYGIDVYLIINDIDMYDVLIMEGWDIKKIGRWPQSFKLNLSTPFPEKFTLNDNENSLRYLHSDKELVKFLNTIELNKVSRLLQQIDINAIWVNKQSLEYPTGKAFFTGKWTGVSFFVTKGEA